MPPAATPGTPAGCSNTSCALPMLSMPAPLLPGVRAGCTACCRTFRWAACQRRRCTATLRCPPASCQRPRQSTTRTRSSRQACMRRKLRLLCGRLGSGAARWGSGVPAGRESRRLAGPYQTSTPTACPNHLLHRASLLLHRHPRARQGRRRAAPAACPGAAAAPRCTERLLCAARPAPAGRERARAKLWVQRGAARVGLVGAAQPHGPRLHA